MAANAGVSAPAATAERIPAIITCGSMSTLAWNFRSTVTCAAKQHDTPSASRLPVRRPASAVCANMTTMPANATIIAIHVRRGTGSFRIPRAASAARNGETLIRMFVFATVVRVSEPMKKKNVPARNAPATTPGMPASRTARGIARPCRATSTPTTKIVMNRLRQKTISHASTIDSWRTSRPPDDQQIAATTMNRIARVCSAERRSDKESFGTAVVGAGRDCSVRATQRLAWTSAVT